MNKKTKQRLDGKKVLIALTSKLEKDAESYCREKNIDSRSELVRQALTEYIYADYSDETLKLQSLKKINDKIAELQDIMNILFTYLRLMHANLLGYFPEIDGQLKDAAYKSATGRHEKFFNMFQETLKNDPHFFERLLSKYFSEINK